MHKIKTVLRLASLGLSQRKIALSCQLGQATVSDCGWLQRPDLSGPTSPIGTRTG